MKDQQQINNLKKIFEENYPSAILAELILMVRKEALESENDESPMDKSASEILELAVIRLRENGR